MLLGTKEKKHFSGGETVLFPPETHVKFICFTLRHKKQKALSLISLRVCGKRKAKSQCTRKERGLRLIEN